jgi:outer membrane receptor protein involved in Fe transport
VLTPGLTVTSTTSETVVTARIRGVGTVGDNPGLESSVGVVIDGVYRPRNGVGFGDLGEVTRIEVLKGPQGTLFGKNTSAGVINIVTAAPTRDVRAESEFTVGNYGAVGFAGSLSGPITSDLSGRIYAAARKRDGFQDVVTGLGPRGLKEDNDQNFYTVRGQLLYAPTPELSVQLIGDYTKRDEHCCIGGQIFVGRGPGARADIIEAIRPGSLDLAAQPFDRIGYANRDTDQRVEDGGLTAEVNYDFSEALRLTSITGWRTWTAETGVDADFTAADLLYRPSNGTNYVAFDQFSQELRLAGTAFDERLNWLVGGFYAKEDLSNRQVVTIGSDFYRYLVLGAMRGIPAAVGLTPGTILIPGGGSDDRYEQESTSWALFTNNSFKVTDALEATLGLRYTRDDKSLTTLSRTTGGACDQAEARYLTIFNAIRASGAPVTVATAQANTILGGLCATYFNDDFDALGAYTQSREEEEVSGTAKLQYRWSPDVMTYVSYSRGYKSGGFNLEREQAVVLTPTGPNVTADPDTAFGGEFVDSWELGAKTSWFSNSLLLNAAAFHQKYTDFQLNTFVGTAFVVEVLPEVISRGVDLDFIYLPPVQGLTFQGGVTYAETEVQPFTAGDLLSPARFPSLSRLPGARLSFAPLWSASLAATYERDLTGDLKLRTNVSAKYTSSYNTGSDLHPSKLQDELVLVNARIGFGPQDERWSLEFWSNNLFDEDYLQVGFNGPFQVDEANDAVSVYDAFLGAPRTFGATLRLRY